MYERAALSGPDIAKIAWNPADLFWNSGELYQLLRLIQDSTRIEQHDRQAERPHLIHHTAIRGALDQVSEFRVEELVREEFPWLKRIQSWFKDHPFRVPAERRAVLRSLNIDWSHQKDLPPDTEPDRLLDYLVDLGIASVRSNRLVDVGDLYLKGLHLKRRGGVARPKRS